MFAVRFVQEEAVKTGFSHESVCKQEMFTSKKTVLFPFLMVEKVPHQPFIKLYGKPCEEQGEVVGGMAAKK